jgi:hypothetical protein
MMTEPEQFSSREEEILALLRDQQQAVKENHRLLRSLRRGMRFMEFMNALRLLILLVPIILASVYLPPLIRDTLQFFQAAQRSLEPGSYPQGFDLNALQQLFER